MTVKTIAKSTVDIDEEGVLKLPTEVLGRLKTRHMKVELEGDKLIMTPAPRFGPLWEKMTPEERAKDFEAWARSHKDGPGLSDWAISRDSIYD